MIKDLPNTSTAAVNKAIVKLRENAGAVALARTMTLVVIADDECAEQAAASAIAGTHEHPARIVVIAGGTKRGTPRLDAQIRVGGDAGAGEVLMLRLYGPLAEHPASVATPFLLPDAPIVGWWATGVPTAPADGPVGALCSRRITDSALAKRPLHALNKLAENYVPGDTDLAWSRITLWRRLVASLLDQPPYEQVRSVEVLGHSSSGSADLLAGWLAMKLRCPVTRRRDSTVEGVGKVILHRDSGDLKVTRMNGDVATLHIPDRSDAVSALPHRPDSECLAEELRRLDNDEVYQQTLIKGLSSDRVKRK